MRGKTSHDVYVVLTQSVHRCDLVCVTKRAKQDKERKLTEANWVFAETTHVVGSKAKFAWRVVLLK